jgi:hypothetical protein
MPPGDSDSLSGVKESRGVSEKGERPFRAFRSSGRNAGSSREDERRLAF